MRLRLTYHRSIVLVHGFQGHPQKTWTLSKVRKTRYVPAPASPATALIKEEFEEDVYWPQDLLPKSIPNARILTYGYDSKVSHFFEGAANQNSFLGHARTLMNDLVAVRRESVR
jgi:hypothetical protein